MRGGLILYGTRAIGVAPAVDFDRHTQGKIDVQFIVPPFSPFEIVAVLQRVFQQAPSIKCLVYLWSFYGGVVGLYRVGLKNGLFTADSCDLDKLLAWLKTHHDSDRLLLSEEEYNALKGVVFQSNQKWHGGRVWTTDDDKEVSPIRKLYRRGLVAKVSSLKNSNQYAVISDTILRAGMIAEKNPLEPGVHVPAFGFEDFVEAALRALVAAKVQLPFLEGTSEVPPSLDDPVW